MRAPPFKLCSFLGQRYSFVCVRFGLGRVGGGVKIMTFCMILYHIVNAYVCHIIIKYIHLTGTELFLHSASLLVVVPAAN